jgi:hypothetical protein
VLLAEFLERFVLDLGDVPPTVEDELRFLRRELLVGQRRRAGAGDLIEGSPDDLCWRSAAGSVSAVSAFKVVEAEVALQRDLELLGLGEVAPGTSTVVCPRA